MYKFSYADILDDDWREQRAREQVVLDRAIELMTIAEARGPNSPEAADAIQFIQRVWGFLIRELSNPDNALADALKADLISVGLWIIKEADRLLADPDGHFSALIEINRTIRDGLT